MSDELHAAIEHELRAAGHPLAGAEVARRARRRKGAVLRALRDDDRYESTGRGRATRWQLRTATGNRTGTAMRAREHEDGREAPPHGTSPENAGEHEAPAEPVATYLGADPRGRQEPAQSDGAEPDGPTEPEHEPEQRHEPEDEHEPGDRHEPARDEHAAEREHPHDREDEERAVLEALADLSYEGER